MNGSEMAEQALKFALETYPAAEIAVLNVIGVPTWQMGGAAGLALSDDPSKAAETQTKEVFERARELAATYDIEITTIVETGSPSEAIVRQAENFDTVVIGSHERGLSSRLLVGNVAAAVTRRSSVPVTVVG